MDLKFESTSCGEPHGSLPLRPEDNICDLAQIWRLLRRYKLGSHSLDPLTLCIRRFLEAGAHFRTRGAVSQTCTRITRLCTYLRRQKSLWLDLTLLLLTG